MSAISLNDKQPRSRSARRFERRTRAKATAGAIICTAAIGLFAGAWLFYDSYYSAGWHTHSGETYYILPENGARATGMQMINNTSYLFSDEGVLLSGWQEYEGGKYYVDASGVVQKGRVTIDGEEYYLSDDSGLFRTGLQDFNGAEYFFDDHGFPGNGFDPSSAVGDHYYDEEGKMITGWADIKGARYYFKENGDMAKGLLEIDGVTYGFGPDGHMLTGIQHIEGREYDFGTDGAAYKGWREADGKFRYSDEETGGFVTGFRTIDDKTYYFDVDFNMVTGKQEIGGKYFLFGNDGVLIEGWYLDDDGNKYYYTRDGAATGLTLIEGLYYMFGKNGVLLTEWYTDEETGDLYYCGKNGVVHDGFVSIEDDVYYMDPVTHKAVTGWLAVYDYPADYKEEAELYKEEMLLLDKYEKSLKDDKVKLTKEEQGKIGSVINGYSAGNGITARQAYLDIGKDFFKLQYFKEDHTMAQGPTLINGYLIYFDEVTGIKSMGWHDFRGKRYYSNYAGIVLTGANTIDGKYYLLGADGALQNGLIEEGGKLRYGMSDGGRVDVWKKNEFYKDEKENIYYFDKNGYAVKGLQMIDNKVYIFGDDYKLKKEFCEVGKDIYYMTPDGALMSKWVSTSDTDTFYFGEDGKAVTGWQRIGGVDYYFNKDHKMVRDWQTIDGKKYYFKNGGLVRGLQRIKDQDYLFSADGSMVKGWVEWNNCKYYCETEGIPLQLVTKEIDGKTYRFSAYGVAAEEQ
ncbi:MAG: hypothetical protein IKP95_02280 [Ruminococcus sp.]|nr:hypothetical protein [Ruminococcus sp.]